MEPDFETLAAYVDGELPVEEMRRIESLLASRPDLAEQVERQRALRASMQDALGEILAEPVPDRLRDLVRNAPAHRSFAALAAETLQRAFAPRVLIPVAALACGLVIGFGLDRAAREEGLFASSSSGRLIAQGALAQALSEQLASAGYPGPGPRIRISFRSRAGQDCRTFTFATARASTAGIACHDRDEWVVGTLTPGEKNAVSGGSYRMAASAMPEPIRSTVSAMIVGQPFDAAGEREARDRSWNPD